jgi:hypothetical protein
MGVRRLWRCLLMQPELLFKNLTDPVFRDLSQDPPIDDDALNVLVLDFVIEPRCQKREFDVD